ncbi:MAG: tetratricopeptide repeat protein, partial [Betaproteobacteria bacterium]
KVIEEHFPQTRDTEPEVLAHHLTAAGEAEAAIPLWQKAGELALKRMALTEAISHLNKGMQLIDALPHTRERDESELALRVPLGTAWMAHKGWAAPEIWSSLHPALALAKSLGRDDALLRILTVLASNVLSLGRPTEALRWTEELLAAADAAGDPQFSLRAHASKMVSYFWLGQLTAARECGEQLLAVLAQTGKDATIFESNTHVPETIWGCCAAQWTWMLGFPDQAVRICEQNDRNAREYDNSWNLAFALGGLGSWLFEYRCEPEVLFARADECERIGRDYSLAFFVTVQAPRTRAVALIRAGELERGIAELSKYLDPPMTTRDMRPYLVTLLAEAMSRTGEHDRAVKLVDEAIAQAEAPGWRGHAHYAESLRVKGWIMQRMENYAEAECDYQRALDWAREQQAKSWELRTSTSLARLWQQQGKRKEAHDLLAPVYNWFTEGFDTKDLKEAKALLDELSV